jgi:type VI protein secretion system component VasK
VLAEQTVDVRASYLDRLVIIGGIVLALVILLAFIVRRVRAAERAELAAESVSERDERYTDPSGDAPRDSEEE